MSRTFDSDIYRNLVFALPMKEGSGTLAYDRAKSSLRHTMTLTGTPTWTAAGLGGRVQCLDFNSAHPDYLQCSAAGSTDLDFTIGAYSMCVWIYADDLAINKRIIVRGSLNVDGWETILLTTGELYARTYQGGATQTTISSAIAATTWYSISFTRVGASIRIYVNGVDKTVTAGTHINPLTSARNFYIGRIDAGGDYFDGKLFFPRIWSRALTPEEVYYIYQTERGLFGV